MAITFRAPAGPRALRAEAVAYLAPIDDRFTGGFDTAGLTAARAGIARDEIDSRTRSPWRCQAAPPVRIARPINLVHFPAGACARATAQIPAHTR